jgi:hypothetical protein
MLLFIPRPASAIELRWISGATNLEFTQAARCTLVVASGSSETSLPGEWRLLWLADSAGVQFVADSLLACTIDTARVSTIAPPATPADSAANLATAEFCAANGTTAATAYYVLDQPGGSQSRFKVVALDPADSNSVLVSNEVTCNGGAAGLYPPIVLKASSVHQSLELRVTAIGASLQATASMRVMAPDSSWSLPLAIITSSESAVTGVASVAALMPECQTVVGSAIGAMSAAVLPPDEEPEFDPLGGCQTTFHEDYLHPPPSPLGFTIQPKDFAFTKGFVDQTTNRFALHIFYIRKNLWYTPAQNDLDEKRLGHAWTTDLNSWFGPAGPNRPDTLFFEVRTGKFDDLHVWAPSIVQRGPTYYMFYTGVRNEAGKRHQRIGVATSTDLITWSRADTVVLSAPDVPWAKKDPQVTYAGAQQLRDPFVMEDPASPGQWLMYFVAVDSMTAPRMAVGVARSDGSNLGRWIADPEPLRSTQRPTSMGTTNVVESPHVFRRNGQWWLPYSVNQTTVFFETNPGLDPTDGTLGGWSNPVSLQSVSEGQPPRLQYWHATEYLKINSTEYLAAFNDNDISIDIKGVFPPANASVDSFALSCPAVASIDTDATPPTNVQLSVSRLGHDVPEGRLRIDLPTPMPIRLAIYDLAGRRRALIANGRYPSGTTTFTWSGMDESDVRLASGVYFARLSYSGGARASKILVFR